MKKVSTAAVLVFSGFSMLTSVHALAIETENVKKETAPPATQAVAPATAAPAVLKKEEPLKEAPTVQQPVVKTNVPAIADVSEGYGKTSGLLGPVIVGPRISLTAGIRPLAFALEAKTLGNWVGASVDYSLLPSFKISGVALSANSIDGRLRFFPFRGAFFIGAAFGQQSFSGTMTKTITSAGPSVDATVQVEIKSLYISPMLGWRWVRKSGFFMGMELGYQQPLSPETKLTTSVTNALVLATAEYQSLDQQVQDAGNNYGKIGLPFVSLLQVGWFF